MRTIPKDLTLECPTLYRCSSAPDVGGGEERTAETGDARFSKAWSFVAAAEAGATAGIDIRMVYLGRKVCRHCNQVSPACRPYLDY